MLSPFRLSVVCRLSVTLVRPAIFLRHLVPWPFTDIRGNFYGGRPRGTPPLRGLNARGVAKHSDFGALGGHILETVQVRR